MRALVTFACLALAAPALAQDDALAKALHGATPQGKPQSCVSARLLEDTDMSVPDTIIYRSGAGGRYVNRLGDCPELRDDRAIVATTPTGDFCRGDIVRIIDPFAHMEYGSCVLGDFQYYRR